MENVAIHIDDLHFSYGTTEIIKNLNFQVHKGEIFGFLGPNGAGKTTTIRLLLGLLEPDKGKARVFGYDTRQSANRIREISGVLLEDHGLYERLTALDNLDFFGRIYMMKTSDRYQRISELLKHLGLWERRNDLVKNFSKGMKRKLAIARSFLHKPKILFLDEPSSGLDPVSSITIRKDILKLAGQENVTIFLNTHNLPEAEKICDRVGIIHQGQLLSIGKPENLHTANEKSKLIVKGKNIRKKIVDGIDAKFPITILNNSEDEIKIGFSDSQLVPQIVRYLVSNDVEIDEIRKEKANLEDVFIKIMEENTNAI